MGGGSIDVSPLNAIFMYIIQCSDLQLKKLVLSHVHFLDKVSPVTLATAKCKIESVDLRRSRLTYNQLCALFKRIQLVHIDLTYANLSINQLECLFDAII